MTKIQEIFLNNMKNARAKLGLSQSKLAEKADVSTGFIADIEIGRRSSSLNTLQKIADVLKLKPYQLLIEEDDIEVYDKKELLNKVQEEIIKKFPQYLKDIENKYIK